ncbi:unnamed protein product [Brassicogethes aeneus]|uniref:Retinol dehydrogenase 14 n=1 Tax=Brassicogethes aeneus TaxID=1431903 RepID=A0A9P0B392_BRAAE|nr:unnamed protein product [Brassicogethes aeneus]
MIASKGFAEKMKNDFVTSNCFHPGMMNSEFLLKTKGEMKFEDFIKPFAKKILNVVTKPIDDGAKLGVHLSTSEKLEKTTGKYFDNYQIHEQPSGLNDTNFCRKIWTASEQYVNMTQEEKLP